MIFKKIKSNSPELLICSCNSRQHQIVIQYDEEDNLIYCHIHLSHRGFWQRLISGFKYIFGYHCRYGHWDEFIFQQEHSQVLLEMSKILKNNKK